MRFPAPGRRGSTCSLRSGSVTATAFGGCRPRHQLSSRVALLCGHGPPVQPRVHPWSEPRSRSTPGPLALPWNGVGSLAGKVCLSLERRCRSGVHGSHTPHTLPAAGRAEAGRASEEAARRGGPRFPHSVLGWPREPGEPRQGGEETASPGKLCPQQGLCRDCPPSHAATQPPWRGRTASQALSRDCHNHRPGARAPFSRRGTAKGAGDGPGLWGLLEAHGSSQFPSKTGTQTLSASWGC